MTATYTYRAYDLVLRLPFPCPVLSPAPDGAVPDVEVAEGDVPYRLAAPEAEDVDWEAEPGRFLKRGGMRAGRFLVEGGEKITLHRNPAAEPERLCFHLLHHALPALLHQRGLLVLHAVAAATASGAVAISGVSGSGKSTLLAKLMARGCAMLGDDVVVARLGQADRVEVLPGVPELHLTEESAEAVGQDCSGLSRYPWRRMKAAVPEHDRMATKALPLSALYLLGTHGGPRPRVHRLTMAEMLAGLQECIYGPMLAREHARMFPLLSAVAQQVPLRRLERPERGWHLDDLASAILDG